MNQQLQSDPVIQRLIEWAGGVEEIRGLILYSSRVDPTAPVDRFSDYDVIVLLRDTTDVYRWHEEDGWLEGFGTVMVVFRNPIQQSCGFETFGFVTHYSDGTKIDYTFYPLDYLRWLQQQPTAPEDLDLGYAVLLDKDGLAVDLPHPAGRAYITPPPSEREYRELVESFFNDACYVAKCICREDLFLAKHCLDEVMKYEYLRVMLEWQVKDAHGWSIRTGAHGKGLKKRVDPALWVELEQTYVGAGPEENWRALFQTVALFRRVAIDVASRLGYPYPQRVDDLVTAHLKRAQNT